MDAEVLVSDGKYVHEAVRNEYGWTGAEPISGYEWEFCLHPEPLYWANKPKPPKVRPEDIPDPVIPKKRKYVRPPKNGTTARAIHDLSKLAVKGMAKKYCQPNP